MQEPANISDYINSSIAKSMCLAPFHYSTTNAICQIEFLDILNFSNCPSDPENVFVVKNEEVMATQLIDDLTSIGASFECRRNVTAFLCLQLFGLCGGSGVFILPSSNQCEDIRAELSQLECNISDILAMDLLDCAVLPPETPSCPAPNDGLPLYRT